MTIAVDLGRKATKQTKFRIRCQNIAYFQKNKLVYTQVQERFSLIARWAQTQ